MPDGVLDELAGRAARAGESLQEYLRGLLIDSVARPPGRGDLQASDKHRRMRKFVGATLLTLALVVGPAGPRSPRGPLSAARVSGAISKSPSE